MQQLAKGYVRKGGKENRRQQLARMQAFAAFCEVMGASELGQVGGRHVVAYWKANRGLSDATLYSHWLAIRHLWRLSCKAGEPPKPRTNPRKAGEAAE